MEYKPAVYTHQVKHYQEAMEEEELRALRRRQRQKIVGCCKKMMAFLFSHIGLAGMVVAYSIMGGFLFQALEAPYELKEKILIINKKNIQIQMIYDMASLMKHDQMDGDNFTSRVRGIFTEFQEMVTVAVKEKGWDGKDTTDVTNLQWSFAGALLYAVTVITTIGYGHVAPKTHLGRVVTIIYALVGIPLTFLYLSNIGNFLADSFRLFYKKICCDLCCCQKCERKRKRERLRLRRRRELAAQRNEAMRLAVVAETQFGEETGTFYGDIVGGLSDENLVMDAGAGYDDEIEADNQTNATIAQAGAVGGGGGGDARANLAYTDQPHASVSRNDSQPSSSTSSAEPARFVYPIDDDIEIRETAILDDDTGDDADLDDGSSSTRQLRPSDSFVRKFAEAKETTIDDTDDEGDTLTRKQKKKKDKKKKDKAKSKPNKRRFFFGRKKKKQQEDDNISIHSQDTIVMGGASGQLDAEGSIKTVDYETVTEASPALQTKQPHHQEEEEPAVKKGRYKKRGTGKKKYSKQSKKSTSSEEPNKYNGDEGDLKKSRKSLHVSDESFVTAPGDGVGSGDDSGDDEGGVVDQQQQQHQQLQHQQSVNTDIVPQHGGPVVVVQPDKTGATSPQTPRGGATTTNPNNYTTYGGIGCDTVINMNDNSYDIEVLDPHHQFSKDGAGGGNMGFIEDPFDYDEDDEDNEHVTVPISICLIIIAGYIFAGSVLFTLWEDWDYLTGSYFCFITLSTIGFGDIVPGTDMEAWASHEKLVLCALWLAFGLSLLAMCFNLMQEEVKDKSKWLGKKLGLLRDDDEG